MKKFKQVNPKQPLVELEQEVFAYWKANKVIEKSFLKPDNKPEFVFFDGPPFATGLPHYGHLVASAIKDTTARFWTMQGYYVDRRFGWDTHGLPIEMLAEKSLGLSGPSEIRAFGINEFNEFCRSNVLKFTAEWEKTILQFGRWADFNNDYKTMDPSFMESVWWVFKQLFDKGLVYKGHKVMPYSPRLSTPLSNFEASQEYKDISTKTAYVSFDILNSDESLVIWTTTPWTLPANLAVAVNPTLEYSLVNYNNRKYYVASTTVEQVFGSAANVEKIVRGDSLVGLKYQPWYDHNVANAYQVLSAEWVDATTGTGLVHLAPAFGVEDYNLCKKHNIGLVDHTDAEGKLVIDDTDLNGKSFLDANDIVLSKLKQCNMLVKTSSIVHRYPFCWRSHTPLMYKAVDVYFIAVESLKDKLIAANETVKWHPEFVGKARFANWLAETKDWAVSRNRFWGTPLPLWTSEDGDVVCIGSVAELEQYVGQKVEDLHAHKVDALEFRKDGKIYKRVPEVFDCWFESGAMPFAQNHYPFDSDDDKLCADFIAEGLDQTRGWFYTLLVLSVALRDCAPYKNVIVNGIVLDKNGEKMSKSKGNYTPVNDLLNTVGGDAVRLYLLSSSVTAANDLKFNDQNVTDLQRTFFIPLQNAHAFFVQYADNYDFDKPSQLSIQDKWLISYVNNIKNKVSSSVKNYKYAESVAMLTGFVDVLNNKYIRNNRARFWNTEFNDDKKAACYALHYALTKFSIILAPFAPFFSEYLYRNLSKEPLDSIHNELWGEEEAVDYELLNTFDLGFSVVELGRAVRERQSLPLKQPLSTMKVFSLHKAKLDLISDLIKSELNVKQLVLLDSPDDLCTVRYKPDFKELGKVFGKDTQEYARKLTALEWHDPVPTWVSDGMYKMQFEFFDKKSTNSDRFTAIGFDLNISTELYREGFLNTFSSEVQKMRKEQGFSKFETCILKLYTDIVLDADEVQLLENTLRAKLVRTGREECTRSVTLNDFEIFFDLERTCS
jgi:isoleucyl-tRNA synthetase